MVSELGHLSLIIALLFAVLTVMAPILERCNVLRATDYRYKGLVWGQWLFVAIAFCALTFCFAINDFTVMYVANHSSLSLPFFYKLCAVWGGHEGSMLLWVAILSTWMIAVAVFSRALSDEFLKMVLSVLAFISAGFFLFLLTTSDPFVRLFEQAPSNGNDLNPLLQDPGFLFHPPMLYMGYVGFSVAFAFAIGALLSGKVDTAWARWARPWTLAAWCCLTVGITLGSWWAYRELGWGGWWFWDPVENASLMPWLVGTALIHSLAVTEKRKLFKAWTLLLALMAFSLSLLGTFLVRSGVLTSVHAFAVSPGRGLFMLGFLLCVIGLSLVIYAYRANLVVSKGTFALLSREMALMLNNVFLAVVMLTVLLGTLYPLLIDALGYGKLSVGAPYFNQVVMWLGLPFLFLLGLGPHCHWDHMAGKRLWQRVHIALLLAIFMGFILPLLLANALVPSSVIGIVLGAWVILSTLLDVGYKLRTISLSQLSFSVWGMWCAHLGVGITVLGIAISTGYGLERDLRMEEGASQVVGGYAFKLATLREIEGPNYQAVAADFQISTAVGKPVATLHPEQRVYRVGQVVMTDADIAVGLFRDLYIALGEPLPDGAWSVRIYIKPFVRWIWAGGFFILFGGLIAMFDKRYRKKLIATEGAFIKDISDAI